MGKKPVSARNDEIVLNLKDILWAIASHWRKILLAGLAAALLVGGASAWTLSLKLEDKAYLASAKEQNDALTAIYEKSLQGMNGMINQMSEDLMQYIDFASQSILYQIDPYKVTTKNLIYYVSTDYQINPDASYQNPDLTRSVLSAYAAAVNRISIQELIGGLDDKDNPFADAYDNNEKLITVKTDNNANILSLTIIAPSESELEILSNAAKGALAAEEGIITQNISEHRLVKLAEYEAVGENENLMNLHEKYEQRMAALIENYGAATTQLSKIKEPELLPVSQTAVSRYAVKYGLIGFVVGVFLSTVYFFFSVTLKGFVLSGDDLASYYPAVILGFVKKRSFKGFGSRLDKSIARHRGLDPEKSREDELDLVAANIQRVARSVSSAALIGTAGKDLITELSDQLSPMVEEMRLSAGGDVLNDAAAVRAFHENEGVIFVDAIGTSRVTDILKAYNLALNDGKKIIGTILIGPDKR